MNPTQSGMAGSWIGATGFSVSLLFLCAFPNGGLAQTTSDMPTMALSEALTRALDKDPRSGGLVARRRAADAGVMQADVRPNPTVAIEIENIAGIGGISLLDRSEVTATYEQPIERGGDRPARVSLARLEIRLVNAEADVRRLDLLERVQLTFAEALGAQADLDIARERLAVTERFRDEVARRVRVARDPLFAGSRADAELALAQIDLDQAETAANAARRSLAAFWMGAPNFILDPELFEATALLKPSFEVITPDARLIETQRALAVARMKVEQARAIPDASIRVGARALWDDRAIAFVVGGSIPLGRYDQNRGAVERAQAEQAVADADLIALRTETSREILRLQARLLAAADEARRIENEIIPIAGKAVAQVREGFNRGGFAYDDVIAAQRALLDAQTRRIAVLKSFHLDRARLDRLVGAHQGLLAREITP